MQQKIVPNLWFNNNAEEAVKFYTSVFKNSKIGPIATYGDAGSGVSGMPKGSVMTIEFQLEGQDYIALNGGPVFKFTPAISLVVNCDSQEEIDTLWSKLTADGGSEVECGWLTDKFGISWQIVPSELSRMMLDSNPKKSERVMAALLNMKKLNIAELKNAYEAST